MRLSVQARCLGLLSAVLAGVVRAGVVSPVYPWTVGTGIECEFGSLQAALDAAAATPGAQTIHVSRLQTYTAQALSISDADAVTIQGGYERCNSTAASGTVALIGAPGNAVIRISGVGDVTLRHLDISGGHGSPYPGSAYGHGGGILHGGTGTLRVEDSRIHDNASSFGSGIAVLGAASLFVERSDIVDNRSGSAAGAESIAGVWANTSGTVLLMGVGLGGNRGAAVYVQQAHSARIYDVSLPACVDGVGLRLAGTGQIKLDNVSISGCDGGAIVHRASGPVSVRSTNLVGNGTLSGDYCSAPHGGLLIAGNGPVDIRDSEVNGNCGMGGGGIGIEAGTVLIERTRIAGNVSIHGGGGLRMEHTEGTPRPVVRFGADVVVEDNAVLSGSAAEGGGIFARNVELDLSQASGHAIRGNSAPYGGGLLIDGGIVHIGSGQAGGSIRDNSADFTGGGIYARGAAELHLYTTDPVVPAGVVGNRTGASGLGGGIAMRTGDGSPKVFVYDARIVDNVAAAAGGVLVLGGDQPGMAFCMGRGREPDSCEELGGTLPENARSCADPAQCNLMQGNRGEGPFGGAALLRAAQGPEPIPVRLTGARVLHNVGRSLFTSMPATIDRPAPNGVFEVFDSAIAANTVSNALFDGAPAGVANFPPDAAHALGRVAIERSTVAGNAIAADYVIGTRQNLRLVESIVYQPFLRVHAGNGAGVAAQDLIVENLAALPVRADIVVADPLLADAGNGDVRPLPGSPAVDFSASGHGGFDVDGVQRGQDAPGVPSRFGLRDLGAHELGRGFLLRDGFESDGKR